MTQNHHSRSHGTSNESSSQAESSSAVFEQVDNFGKFLNSLTEEERAKAAEEASIGGRHCPNDDRLNSLEDGQKGRGVQSGITDPTKLQFVGFAIDWIRFPVFGRAVAPEVLERLKVAKREAMESSEPVFVELGGWTWRVVPKTDAKGSNSLPYVLSCAGVVVSLGEGSETRPVKGSGVLVTDGQRSEKRPIAAIEATGRYCCRFHPLELQTDLKAILARMGVVASRYGVPSRLDVRGDVAGLHVARFAQFRNEDKTVCRADEDDAKRTHRIWNAVTFGKRGSRVFCRIYDKVLELSKDDQKREAYLKDNGLEKLPEVLTRVEFEMRNEFFRETWNARSLGEVFDSLGALVEYLMHDWLRFCSSLDLNHTNRAKTVSWWAWLRSKMVTAARVTGERPKAETLPPDPSRLFKQAMGCIKAACAMFEEVPKDALHGFAMCAEFLGLPDDRTFVEGVKTKILLTADWHQRWLMRRPSETYLAAMSFE